jgi:UDP-2-acetamido-3-amino-2,3-dideoxy-glucuronate N-acetyltransferase
VVTKDIPDFALVYGNPAVVRGWVCNCGVKLSFHAGGNAACAACGAAYIKQDGQIREEIATLEK